MHPPPPPPSSLHPAAVSLCCMFLVCVVLVSHFFSVCGHLSDIDTRLENFKAFSSQRKPESDQARAAVCDPVVTL